MESCNRYSPLGMVMPCSHREMMLVLANPRRFRTCSCEKPESLRCSLNLFGMVLPMSAVTLSAYQSHIYAGEGRNCFIRQLLWITRFDHAWKTVSLENG